MLHTQYCVKCCHFVFPKDFKWSNWTFYFIIKGFLLIHPLHRISKILQTWSKRFHVSGNSRRWVSMIDCFTTGIVIYKQGNYLWSTGRGLCIGVSSTHKLTFRASWFTSTVRQPSASCCFHCCGHYLFISLPTHACTPSPSVLLFSLIIPDPKTGGGDTT